MLKTAFGEQAIGRSQTFQWFSRFKAGRTSIDDDERSGRPVSTSMPEMIERLRQIIREDCRRTIDEVSMLVGISHGTCHKILTDDLKMRCVTSKFVPRILSVDQKQQWLDVCLDLKENAANNPSFLSNVITGDETWVYAYDPETKTQSSQWKSPGSPRPKKARQVRSNIKSMLICFFDQKGTVHKNLFLLVKQLTLHSTSKFWNVSGIMCEGSNLISGNTTHGCSTMTMRQPMLPSWLDGFWLITTWLWCHILPTRPTLHPATFSYFQNWKWSLRGEDFRQRKLKQSRRPSWTRYEKMT